MGRLDNKVAIVTGATSGIGQATAIMFAAEGAKVVAVGRSQEKGAATMAEIEAAGGEAVFVAADVRERESIDRIKAALLDNYGHIDVLCNAAGILIPLKGYLDQTDDDLQLVMETNFRGYSWMMQTFIPLMLENGGGSIINVASISTVWPELGSFYYGAMKAAISNLSQNVAKEFAGQGIRVNTILPGPVRTGMTPKLSDEQKKDKGRVMIPLGRLGEPKDIAYGAVYLASDESCWVTNSALKIDGGMTLGV